MWQGSCVLLQVPMYGPNYMLPFYPPMHPGMMPLYPGPRPMQDPLAGAVKLQCPKAAWLPSSAA